MDDPKGHSVLCFVLKPSDNLICPLCLDVLSNPNQCQRGHNFCFVCITQSLEVFNHCPVCIETLELKQLSKNLFLNNIINDLEVKCHVMSADIVVADEDVCHWKGPLHCRDDHIRQCQFRRPIVCPFPAESCRDSCPRIFSSRKFLQNHLTECNDIKTKELKQRIFPLNTLHRAYTTKQFPENANGPEPYKGAIYSGGIFNSVRHGWGIFECFNGKGASLYAGQFVNDLANGQGYKKSKTHTYNGMWKDGLMHGHCFAFTRPNGVSGCGEFSFNLLEGHGKMWREGDEWCYEGEFHKDKRHGQGKLTFPCGKSTFVGSFVDDVINGQGVLSYGERTISGTFNDKGECHGKGVFQRLCGEVIFEGDFQHNLFHGHGVAHIPDGSVYNGTFVKGKRHGRGTMTFADKSEYRGQFSQDEIHGKGVLVSADGVVGAPKYYIGGVIDHNKIVFDLMDV